MLAYFSHRFRYSNTLHLGINVAIPNVELGLLPVASSNDGNRRPARKNFMNTL